VLDNMCRDWTDWFETVCVHSCWKQRDFI